MACLSQLKGCNVHVYERSALGFKRISAFDHPDNPQSKPVVRVLYCGGIHYGESGGIHTCMHELLAFFLKYDD